MKDFRDDLLRLILDKVTVENERLAIKNQENLLKTERFGILLISELLETEKYQERFDAIQYSWQVNTLHPLLFEPFETVIVELKNENNTSFDEFKKRIDRELEKISNKTNLIEYNFLYPIRIQPTKKLVK